MPDGTAPAVEAPADSTSPAVEAAAESTSPAVEAAADGTSPAVEAPLAGTAPVAQSPPSEPATPSEDQRRSDIVAALEAVCFSLNRPVAVSEATAILACHAEDIIVAAEELAARLRGSGMMLQRHADQLQLVTRPEVAWAVQRALNPERPGRLSRAALETLAIVAYRQPVTRAGIEAIRGVGCEAVLESLERRGLITEVGRQESPGLPRLFGTTLRFLQMVGLEHVGELPPLPAGLVIPHLDGEPTTSSSL
ncbi:MAG: SMC-Scp complex subunit ScpB [Candidatus Dormibacteria bacterium]